jgi:hypothetical protein
VDDGGTIKLSLTSLGLPILVFNIGPVFGDRLINALGRRYDIINNDVEIVINKIINITIMIFDISILEVS